MTESDNNTTVAEEPAVTSPGKQLREAREARGLTQQEAAVKLHLHQRMLVALELDDYDQLPSPIYVRGYLRNYARLLELDPEHIVAAYEGSEDEHLDLKPPLKAPSQASSSDKPVKAVTYLLTLALVLLLLAWWQSRNVSDDSFMEPDGLQQIAGTDNGTDRSASGDSTEEQVLSDSLGYPIRVIHHPDTAFYPLPSKQAPATAGASAAAAPADDTATTPAELLETLPEMEGDETGTPESSATAPEQTAAAPGTADTGNNDPDAATDSGQGLQLEINKESWVEVYDAAGKRLYLGLGKPGEVIQVDGRTPLRVLLGYAPGVAVRFNGETINTIEHSRAGVAEFTVGQ